MSYKYTYPFVIIFETEEFSEQALTNLCEELQKKGFKTAKAMTFDYPSVLEIKKGY